ncbi:efflux RND transporter periplasmic adaptor subunit [Psychrosphaera aestuarii]|uniref:efflux RND transporter periplasmic adaptor subunit n=1 Tax=Psychrosphaera aestuarii TaxID=1266052 RepID=UPI001B32CD20|nr:efflux RND transporter periplasmic adaptor subunit [Psychrosphaera aestuarii]
MSKKWLKIAAPVVILLGGAVAFYIVQSNGPKPPEKKEIDTRPTVTVQQVNPEFHQIRIRGYGAVTPLEKTMISAQVSGEVVKWHPNFVEGGLVKRGEVLFEIESDTYEVALLQAESQLKTAQAQLIEEQGRAEVAKREAKSMPNERVSDLYLRKPQVMSAEAAVKLAQGSVKLAQRDLDNCRVLAPYDALIIKRDLGTGQFVNRGTNVGELYNVEKAEIVFPVAGFDRTFLPNTLTGLRAEISTREKFSSTRNGTIVRDTGIVDQATRMGNIVVEVEDPYGLKADLPRLMFGTYVEVSFDGQGLNNIVKLSQDLVTNNRVWVLGDNNTLKQKKVEVVKEEGKTFLISGGLNPEDQLIMTIPEYAQDGMKVKLAGESDKKNDKPEDDSNVVPTSVAQSNKDA